MKVFVLGHKGMLGNCLQKYLEEKKCKVITTYHRWDTEAFKNDVLESNSDFIINCIYSAPHKNNSGIFTKNNFELPFWLINKTKAKILLPGTDGEFSGKQNESSYYYYDSRPDATDIYGKSKAQLTQLTKTNNRVRVIRSSIIGIENNSANSLLSWFLKLENGSTVNGFTNVLWNGISTLEWAKTAYKLLLDWDCIEENSVKKSNNLIQIGSEKISKYELLNLFNLVFDKKMVIKEFLCPDPINRCLYQYNTTPSIHDQIVELKYFYGL